MICFQCGMYFMPPKDRHGNEGLDCPFCGQDCGNKGIEEEGPDPMDVAHYESENGHE